MTVLGWSGVSLRLWTISALFFSMVSSGAHAIPTATADSIHVARRFSGVEIGNGGFELGIGSTNEQVELPNTVSTWATRAFDTCIELIAPADANSSSPTKLKVCLKPYDQLDDDQLKELEEVGWRRFFWSDMDGLRIERPWKTRAFRALEVRLFRDTREAIELFLVGNKTSPSFASVYEWLTPKRENKEENL